MNNGLFWRLILAQDFYLQNNLIKLSKWWIQAANLVNFEVFVNNYGVLYIQIQEGYDNQFHTSLNT